jgi:cell division protein FtsQ
MPLSSNFTARVPVASGNISFQNNELDTVQDSQREQLFDLVEFIRADPFWKAQTEQIYVNDNNEIELIPKLENHVFLLGDVNDLEAEFRRMNIFYKEVLKNQKSDQFKIINVKFKNQIICSKN